MSITISRTVQWNTIISIGMTAVFRRIVSFWTVTAPMINGGMLSIDAGLFDRDALIIEGKQAKRVSLCDRDKKPYLSVSFDSPLFGLWSPAGKHAPFICIEPWYGRCDKASFEGTLEEREYGNVLKPGEIFEKEYQVEIL